MKTKTVYEAEDGKEFESEQACLEYEFIVSQESKVNKIKEKLEKLADAHCDSYDYEGSASHHIADFIYQKFSEIEVIIKDSN